MNILEVMFSLIILLTVIDSAAKALSSVADWRLKKYQQKKEAMIDAQPTDTSAMAHTANRRAASAFGFIAIVLPAVNLSLIRFSPPQAGTLTAADAASIAISLMLFYLGIVALRR